MKYLKASFISKTAVVFSMFRNAFMFRPLLKHSIRYQSSTTANIFSSAASVVVEDFGENFMVPLREHRLPLEDLNSHPLDQRIVFIENDHKYIVDGQPMKYSVTGLLPEYFDKFNSSSVAEKMMSKNNWPGEGYKHPNEQPYTLEEILKKWNDNGLDARNRGTWMHFNIESYLNGMDSTASFPPEFEQFLQFHRAHIVDRQIQPFRTEWNVFSKKIDIAGSVDFVGKLPDNTYEIIDWKRSKDLESNLVSNYNKKAKEPLQHLWDSKGTKYFLQVNIYRHILESEYGLTISAMTVATFHPNLKSYFAVPVPRWDKEVQDVLTHYLANRDKKSVQEFKI